MKAQKVLQISLFYYNPQQCDFQIDDVYLGAFHAGFY